MLTFLSLSYRDRVITLLIEASINNKLVFLTRLYFQYIVHTKYENRPRKIISTENTLNISVPEEIILL